MKNSVMLVIGIVITSLLLSQTALADETYQNQCRKSFFPAKETFSTCRSKFINICACECRSYEGSERSSCIRDCQFKGICDTCLVYTLAALAGDLSLISNSLCSISTKMLRSLDEMAALKGFKDDKGFNECRNKVVAEEVILTDDPRSLLTQLEARLNRNRIGFKIWDCAVSTYGKAWIIKGEKAYEYKMLRKEFNALISKFQYTYRYEQAYVSKGLDLSCRTAQFHKTTAPICGSYSKLIKLTQPSN